MKKTRILLFGFLIALLVSCGEYENNSTNISFAGKAQKGPFIAGTNVTLNELNPNLSQTGNSFTTTISADDGSFSLIDIELNSDLALLTANGFYFSEIYGEPSEATLSLQAITDLSGKESVNINVLTHVIKERVEKLVADGMNFHDSNEQAKSEFITFLGVTELFDNDFDNLDISVDEEYNSVLLAFSVILQRYTMVWNERPYLTAELTQLLSNLASDFSTDGLISDRTLIDTLLFNISQLNLIDIRANVEEQYSNLGQSVNIPDFEKYIAKFQEKYDDNLYTNFTYPVNASPEPLTAPDATLPNLLVPSDTIFQAGAAYSVAAIIPLNKTLKIKFIGSNVILGGPVHGWELINEYPNGFTLNSQRQNEQMSMLINLESSGNATIEYYENDMEIPTFTKHIKWE